MKSPNSVILISLDTLRSDVAYSGKFPTLHRLCNEGTWFQNVVSSSPLTPVSHASVLTGLDPKRHGIRHLFRESLKDDVTTLAKNFYKCGYRTGAIVSCPGLNSWYGLNQGFEYYNDDIPLLPDGSDPLNTIDVRVRGTALKRADVVVEKAFSWINSMHRQPFFLFMHFFDAHWPYNAPTKFIENLANPYEEEVAYIDYHLGIFLKKLESCGFLKNTLIVCFSDHGEDLEGWYPNDHGGSNLGHPEESGHGCLLFDATLMVPLIFRLPGKIPEGISINSQVRLIDIAPTLYDLFEINGQTKLDGESLVPAFIGKPINSRVALSETHYPREQFLASGLFPNAQNKKSIRIDNMYKVIWEIESDEVECYNLVENPLEKEIKPIH